MKLSHETEDDIPICIAGAPSVIVDAARTIAAASLETIRETIDEQVGGCEKARRNFIAAVCYYMVKQSIDN